MIAKPTIVVVIGTRPESIKLAPVISAMLPRTSQPVSNAFGDGQTARRIVEFFARRLSTPRASLER